MLDAVAKVDRRLSLAIFNTSHNAPLKLLADIISFTGDEAMCFPVSSFLGFALLFMAEGSAAMGARRILRIYGDMGAMCLLEQAIKAVVRRQRPNFRVLGDFYCM